MIVEAIRKLYVFNKVETYNYIGFGSVFFSDFSLFHKSLGITNMISIEKNSKDSDRFNFNKPFACIDVKYGESSTLLPSMPLNEPSIIWFDYDGRLNSSVLMDIQTICTKICESSLFFISVNANAENKSEITSTESDNDESGGSEYVDPNLSLPEYRIAKLINEVGEDKIPIGMKGHDLSQKGILKVLRTIITNEINSSLITRNSLGEEEEGFIYKQLFNIHYKDDANMLTIGGLFIKKNQEPIFNSAKFDELDFISFDDNIYRIEVPMLTLKEIAYLDAYLHELYDFSIKDMIKISAGSKSKYSAIKKIISESEIKKYAKLYRYYPIFTEVTF